MKNRSIILQDYLAIIEEQQNTSTDSQRDFVNRRLQAIEDLVLQQNPTKVDERNICETITKLANLYPGTNADSFYKRLIVIYRQKGLQPKTDDLKNLFSIRENVDD